MFRIKICGVTRTEDIDLVAQAGGDSIGINLVSISPRCVQIDKAIQLKQRADELGLRTIIVVMNPSESQLRKWIDEIQPYAVQLHGQETPELIDSFPSLRIIKAISWTGREEERQLASLWQARRSSSDFAFLVDAYAPNVGGGTGKVARWDLLDPCPAELSQAPLLLAGGLTATNVGAAIDQTRCLGVDTASGVETSPGIKDPAKVAAFCAQALAHLK